MRKFASCLYFGEVIHERFFPRRHRLRYRVFQGLFDVDELPHLGRKLRLFSHNRGNVFSFYDCDHGNKTTGALRPYIESLLRQAGLPVDNGPIALLCVPRVSGFVFNPLSIYFCRDSRGDPLAIVYEVNNTFNQRHTYVIPVDPSVTGDIRQSCRKEFYVSPFMDMDMNYEFKLSLPASTLAIRINGNRADGARLILASFTGSRRELSDTMLLSALFSYPLLTLGVVAAIHWEALKLFAKGLRLRPRLSPPPASVTFVEPAEAPQDRGSQSFDRIHKIDKQSA